MSPAEWGKSRKGSIAHGHGHAQLSPSILIMEELTRRMPEDNWADADQYSLKLLAGVAAGPERTSDSQWQDEDLALAAMAIRRFFTGHPCSRKKMSDPECTHPDHYRDVAFARHVFDICGLPGGVEMIPLADAARDYWKKTHMEDDAA